MTATIGSEGARLDIKCRPGTRLGPFNLEFKDDAGAPMDLTGYDVRVRCTTREATPREIEIVADILVPATDGIIQITMDPGVTATLPAPSNVSAPPRVGADWGLDLLEGGVTPVAELYGEIRTHGAPPTV